MPSNSLCNHHSLKQLGFTLRAHPILFITRNNYLGPEGARVKVPPLFFVIIICGVLNFLLGYKA